MTSRLVFILGLLACGLPTGLVVRAEEDRGYLGVGLENVPEVLAHHLSLEGGALIVDITPGGPAEKSALRVHDIIQAAGGETVKNRDALREKVRSLKPGDRLKLGLRRGPESVEVDVTLGSLAEAVKRAQTVERPQLEQIAPPAEKEEKKDPRGFLGIGFGGVPALLAEHLKLAEGVGIIVKEVWKDSSAQKAGIEKNDVILNFDGHEIKGPGDFAKLISEKGVGANITLEILHKGHRSTLTVGLSERPMELSGAHEDSLWSPAQGGDSRGPDARRFHRGPGPKRRGRVIIEGPHGRTWQLDMPDTFWEAQELSKDFQLRLKGLQNEIDKETGRLRRYFDPEALSRRLRKLTEDLELPSLWKDAEVSLDGEGVDSNVRASTSQSQSSVVSIVENGLQVTVEEHNGLRTVTVSENGRTIAEKLPWEKLDTLPQEIREQVEKVAEGLKTFPLPGAEPNRRIKA